MRSATNTNELQDLYRELIIDHARAPRNFGKPARPTHTATGINPLCGDKLHIYLTVDEHQALSEICFEGSGCAISMASASLLTETVKHLSVDEAERCYALVTRRLSLDAGADESLDSAFDLSKIRALDGVREHPSRIKCATLAWHAMHAALSNATHPATTE